MPERLRVKGSKPFLTTLYDSILSVGEQFYHPFFGSATRKNTSLMQNKQKPELYQRNVVLRFSKQN